MDMSIPYEMWIADNMAAAAAETVICIYHSVSQVGIANWHLKNEVLKINKKSMVLQCFCKHQILIMLSQLTNEATYIFIGVADEKRVTSNRSW